MTSCSGLAVAAAGALGIGVATLIAVRRMRRIRSMAMIEHDFSQGHGPLSLPAAHRPSKVMAVAGELPTRLEQWRLERWDAQASPLLQLPMEVLTIVLAQLADRRDIAHLAATCYLLWFDAPTAPARQIGPVETELRRRAEARRLVIGAALPEGATSWVSYMLKREHRDAQRRHAPLAGGVHNSAFVDREGRLLTCGQTREGTSSVLGHAEGSGVDAIGPPKLVPSMLDRRIVSVASGNYHFLALGAEGEVYSWGKGVYFQLGHGDVNDRAVPSRITSLEHIESIAAGTYGSAAVDDRGRLFSWGRAWILNDHMEVAPCGLGYAVDLQTRSQPTPRRVDALSQDRVVGVAMGDTFTLAVTDAGAVFSFGNSQCGALGLGSLESSEKLPRRVEALARTGRRFVVVAAAKYHAHALTEEGQLYGWGAWGSNGHGVIEGPDKDTPELVTALVGERLTLVYAGSHSSCAVTETGEMYTWGRRNRHGHLGYGDVDVGEPVPSPRRVERLSGVKVAAVANGGFVHMLVADEDGGAWACGEGAGLGLCGPGEHLGDVTEPTQIPTLRVWDLRSSGYERVTPVAAT